MGSHELVACACGRRMAALRQVGGSKDGPALHIRRQLAGCERRNGGLGGGLCGHG
jgi:hypothetical protein